MSTDWDAASARLRADLESMADGDVLVVEDRGRYVQFSSARGWVYGECVGAKSFGGDCEISPEQHEAIRAAGWLAPGDEDETGTQPAYPNYWRTVPFERAGELAGMGVAALEALGADPGMVESKR